MAEQNPKGEPHPTIPHLYKKPAPPSAARDFYPYLRSNEEWRKQQDEAEARERIRRDKWR